MERFGFMNNMIVILIITCHDEGQMSVTQHDIGDRLANYCNKLRNICLKDLCTAGKNFSACLYDIVFCSNSYLCEYITSSCTINYMYMYVHCMSMTVCLLTLKLDIHHYMYKVDLPTCTCGIRNSCREKTLDVPAQIFHQSQSQEMGV